MDALKGKGKGKGKRGKGKREKLGQMTGPHGAARMVKENTEKTGPHGAARMVKENTEMRGREGKRERAEKGSRNPAAGSKMVDCGVYGDCRDLYEKWRTELETIQIWRWTGKLCLFEKLKC